MINTAGIKIPAGNPNCNCVSTGGCEKCNPTLAMTNKTKTSNKWVKEFLDIEVDVYCCDELCDGKDHVLQDECEAKFKAFIQQVITQTQQETLEWCEKEMVNKARNMLYVELGLNAEQVLKGMTYFRKWMRQTIKNKLEEKWQK